METVDYVILGVMFLMFLLFMWQIAPPHLRGGSQPPRKVTPPKPKPEPEVKNVQHVTPRRPVVCSIELSSQQVFDAIADSAIEKSGRDDLQGLHWEITLYYTENKVKLKGAVVEFQDGDIKKRGKLWLVKG